MSKGKHVLGILICEVTYLMIKGKHHFAIYFGSTFRFLDFRDMHNFAQHEFFEGSAAEAVAFK